MKRIGLGNKDSVRCSYPFQHRWQMICHPVHSNTQSDLPKERFHISDINLSSFKQSLLYRRSIVMAQ